ncbi:hypothetical protein LDENG_00099630 [Lucifuga dentata]|nr:hypothetical protein LDENG_00099630 [Lucifuga dentata]
MVNFYHLFIPQAAELMLPLYEALKGRAARHAVDWTKERENAFVDAKTVLANPTAAPHEWKYSTFDWELLGLYLAKWQGRGCFLLEVQRFTAFVDHKPLMFMMAKTTEPWSACQQCQLSFISEFTTDIQHVTGKQPGHQLALTGHHRGHPLGAGLHLHGGE